MRRAGLDGYPVSEKAAQLHANVLIAVVQWRGCSHGCLDFLEEPTDTLEKVRSVVGFETSQGEDGNEFEFSDEE